MFFMGFAIFIIQIGSAQDRLKAGERYCIGAEIIKK